MSDFEHKYKGMNITQLAQFMADIKGKLDEAAEKKTELQKEFDFLRLIAVPNQMDELDVSSLNIKGIGRVGVSVDMYTSMVADKKDEAYQWLKDNGYGDIIKPTVNSSSLKALIKEQIKKGVEIPTELFKVVPFERASITKK